MEDVQCRHLGRDAYLDAYLDAILARRQDRFRNQTYLTLPLLELILTDPESGLDPERLSVMLIADVIRHESQPSSLDATGEATNRKRIQHAGRIVAAVNPHECPMPPKTPAGQWFALSALPVSTVHDEYFFIRALQTHEMVYTTLAAQLRAATAALRSGQVAAAAALVRRANEVFQRAALLFRMVATMRPGDFHAFRVYTDGASAIQSEAYKRFEIACRRPSAARLASDAFSNVPAVRAEVFGQDNLTQASGTRPTWPATRHTQSSRTRWPSWMPATSAGRPPTAGWLERCSRGARFGPHDGRALPPEVPGEPAVHPGHAADVRAARELSQRASSRQQSMSARATGVIAIRSLLLLEARLRSSTQGEVAREDPDPDPGDRFAEDVPDDRPPGEDDQRDHDVDGDRCSARSPESAGQHLVLAAPRVAAQRGAGHQQRLEAGQPLQGSRSRRRRAQDRTWVRR